MEIKIICENYKLYGIQRTEFGEFHTGHEKYLYLGNAVEGEIVTAKLVYQAEYPSNQWANMSDELVKTTDRITRRVYKDSY